MSKNAIEVVLADENVQHQLAAALLGTAAGFFAGRATQQVYCMALAAIRSRKGK
jgi:hypothetical protein